MNIIVAVDKNYGIGKDGGLLFSIPEDMAFFRSMTRGKTVIMGRKTLESLPGGRPLKGRRNIVFSRDPGFNAQGVERVSSVEELMAALGKEEDAFVIGGEAIYAALLPYCDRAYVTMVKAEAEADRFFPNIQEMADWTLADASQWKEHEGLPFQFREYRRVFE
ncbi:MAG: dihydrofolate reductase [Clostridia bacterium]|nr:dihydrofolate reductase [Clostridia bacterium]MBQ6704277.1 dihydrofolate reductase [Clostridia bacterium]